MSTEVEAALGVGQRFLAAIPTIKANAIAARDEHQRLDAEDQAERLAEARGERAADRGASKRRVVALVEAQADLRARVAVEESLHDEAGRVGEVLQRAESQQYNLTAAATDAVFVAELTGIREAVAQRLSVLASLIGRPISGEHLGALHFLVESLPSVLGIAGVKAAPTKADASFALYQEVRATRQKIDEAREELARERRRAQGLPF